MTYGLIVFQKADANFPSCHQCERNNQPTPPPAITTFSSTELYLFKFLSIPVEKSIVLVCSSWICEAEKRVSFYWLSVFFLLWLSCFYFQLFFFFIQAMSFSDQFLRLLCIIGRFVCCKDFSQCNICFQNKFLCFEGQKAKNYCMNDVS